MKFCGLYMENKPVRIVHELDYEIHIFWGQEDRIEHDSNVDVEVKLCSGVRYFATFFTIQNIASLLQRYKTSGECASGLYFWATDMILVEKLSVDVIRETIKDLISTGEIEIALTKHV